MDIKLYLSDVGILLNMLQIKYNDTVENALKRQKKRDVERRLKKIDLLDSGKVVPGSYGTGKRR